MVKYGYVLRSFTAPNKGKYWTGMYFGFEYKQLNQAFVFGSYCNASTWADPNEQIIKVKRTIAGRWKIVGVVKDE